MDKENDYITSIRRNIYLRNLVGSELNEEERQLNDMVNIILDSFSKMVCVTTKKLLTIDLFIFKTDITQFFYNQRVRAISSYSYRREEETLLGILSNIKLDRLPIYLSQDKFVESLISIIFKEYYKIITVKMVSDDDIYTYTNEPSFVITL